MLTRRPFTRRVALAAIASAIATRQALATPDATRDWLASKAKGTPQGPAR